MSGPAYHGRTHLPGGTDAIPFDWSGFIRYIVHNSGLWLDIATTGADPDVAPTDYAGIRLRDLAGAGIEIRSETDDGKILLANESSLTLLLIERDILYNQTRQFLINLIAGDGTGNREFTIDYPGVNNYLVRVNTDGLHKFFIENSSGAFQVIAPDNTTVLFEVADDGTITGSNGTIIGNIAVDTLWDAKGDLAVASGADAADNLAVGTDGQVLTAASSETLGVRWAPSPTGASPGGGGSARLYEYTVTGSDKASIDTFVDGTAVPDFAGYDVLEIWLTGRTDEAVRLSLISWTLNNDTSNVYDRGFVSTSTASTTAIGDMSAGAAAWSFVTAGASMAANVAGTTRLSIPNYLGTTFYKTGEVNQGAVDTSAANTNRQAIMQVAQYRNTAAITRLAVTPATAGKKFKVGTRLIVYGR